MNTKMWIAFVFGSVITFFIAGCNMSTGGPGPRAWIDSPLDGSTLPLEPVVVRSHAASDSGTRSAILYVNGSQVSTDNVTDPNAPLVEISQVWVPSAAGDYEIYVIALDAAGNQGRSNPVRVHIGGDVVNPSPSQGGQPPEQLATAVTTTPTSIQDVQQPPPAPACQAPTFTFSMNANCRAGPSTDYEVDASFLQGQSAQIDGRNDSSSRWWWVLVSSNDHCWVSDSTGSASCLVADVPVIVPPPPPVVITITDTSAPPPPPAPSAPTAPGNLSVTTHVCASPTYSVTLGWLDTAGNEQGYRVYRNNDSIATLGANATSYTDLPPGSGPYTYKVEAFNNEGSASSTTTDPGCIF